MSIISKILNRYQVAFYRAIQGARIMPLETKLKKDNWLSNAMSSVRKLFTGKKYSITYQERLNRVLIQACSSNDIGHIKHLLDKGANAHLDNSFLLFEEVSKSSRRNEIMELLISRGANIYADNDELFCTGSILGSTAFVQMMLNLGYNIHAQNDYALKAAAYNYNSSLNHFSSQDHLSKITLLLIDYNMHIKEETKQWLEENKYPEVLEILAKRDLSNNLESALKSKEETIAKPRKIKI